MRYQDKTYLAHHGILGQKWGVRRFQNKDGSYTAAGKKRKNLDKNKKENDTEDKKKGLSRNQKIAIAATGVALTAIGGYYLYKTGKLDGLINVGKNAVKNNSNDILGLSDERTNKFIPTVDNISKCATNINPSGSRTNCGSVASAVIANLKTGLNDCVALDQVPEHMRQPGKQGYDPKKLIDCFEGGSWETNSGMNRKELAKNVEQTILKHGEGASGLMYPDAIRGKSSSHYFSWIVLNGKVNIIEGQPPSAKESGIIWNNNFFDDVGQMFDPSGEVHVARLDNCPIKPGREKDLFSKRK